MTHRRTRRLESTRASVAFLAWTRTSGRSREIAAALGGEARTCFIVGWPAPVRYLVATVQTVSYLISRRPLALIVTNPPVFPVLIGWVYSTLSGVPLVIDAHPGSFGLKETRIGQLMLPVSRWLAPRVETSLVTTAELAARVEALGGRADILHEAPPGRVVDAPPPPTPLTLLFVSIFASDEPVDAVLEAARATPEIEIRITGDLSLAPLHLLDRVPANVTFVGYLDADGYWEEIRRAHGVVALTTEANSVMRAAYEAVYAKRPLVISDWPVLRELFPAGVAVNHDPSSLADGFSFVKAHLAELLDRAESARECQQVRWDGQLCTLRSRLHLRSNCEPPFTVASVVDAEQD